METISEHSNINPQEEEEEERDEGDTDVNTSERKENIMSDHSKKVRHQDSENIVANDRSCDNEGKDNDTERCYGLNEGFKAHSSTYDNHGSENDASSLNKENETVGNYDSKCYNEKANENDISNFYERDNGVENDTSKYYNEDEISKRNPNDYDDEKINENGDEKNTNPSPTTSTDDTNAICSQEQEPQPCSSSPPSCSKGATPPTSLPLVSKTNMKPPAKNCFRLVVLGASRVGKTSIVSRFLNNKFEESYTPTIEDFHRKLYRIRGDVYQLDILDTSGNHPFPAMRRLSFLTGDLFILVFSWDCRESWSEILRLREQILETKQCVTSSLSGSRRRFRGVRRVPMVIAGNKADKESRVVTKEEVQQFVSSLSCCAYVDTSAKINYNVDKLFYELFVLANLPMEMSPALHKRVCPIQIQQGQTTATSCPVGIPGSSSRHRGLSIRRRLSDAYGMVAPNVRRPSIRTDLLILRAKTSLHLNALDTYTEKKPRKEVSCVIQ